MRAICLHDKATIASFLRQNTALGLNQKQASRVGSLFCWSEAVVQSAGRWRKASG